MWCIEDFKGFTVGKYYSRHSFDKMQHLDNCYYTYHNGKEIDIWDYNDITRATNAMVRKLKNKKNKDGYESNKEKIYIPNDFGEVKSLTNKQIRRYFTEDRKILEVVMIAYNRNKKLERLIKE